MSACGECGHPDPHDVPPIQLCRVKGCGCDGEADPEVAAFFVRLRKERDKRKRREYWGRLLPDFYRAGWPSKTDPPKRIGWCWVWVGPYIIGWEQP